MNLSTNLQQILQNQSCWKNLFDILFGICRRLAVFDVVRTVFVGVLSGKTVGLLSDFKSILQNLPPKIYLLSNSKFLATTTHPGKSELGNPQHSQLRLPFLEMQPKGLPQSSPQMAGVWERWQHRIGKSRKKHHKPYAI